MVKQGVLCCPGQHLLVQIILLAAVAALSSSGCLCLLKTLSMPVA